MLGDPLVAGSIDDDDTFVSSCSLSGHGGAALSSRDPPNDFYRRRRDM